MEVILRKCKKTKIVQIMQNYEKPQQADKTSNKEITHVA